MPLPLVCMVVLNWNGKALLQKCLPDLRKTKYGNYQVIVTDNGSTDGSQAFVKTQKNVDLVALDRNHGFGGGNNKGAEYALKKYRCAYVLLLNNDIEIIQPEWLSWMVELAESDPKIGIVGCKLLLPDGRIQHAGGYFHPLKISGHRGMLEGDSDRYDDVREMDYVTGAAFLIKKDVIDAIGLMDEKYFPIYFEEADYCVRARKAGFRTMYTGRAKLTHHTSATMSRETEEKQYYIWEKNRLRFVRTHFPFWWKPFAYARIAARAVFSRHPVGRLKLLVKCWKESGK